MTKLFVDTSGWASLFLSTESHHVKAIEHFEQVKRTSVGLVTTNYIISELVALLPVRQRVSRNNLFQYIDSIRLASFVDTVHINLETDLTAWNLCKSRPDNAWSLVDASSFVVMRRLDIQTALTTDRHFEQAGFVRLLK